MVLENSIDCTTALLCSDIQASTQTVVVGTFDKKVKMFDLRSAKPAITAMKHHKMPVLSVCALPNNTSSIISASEDGTIALIDKRNRKVVSRIRFQKESYPMCMKVLDQGCPVLVVGDKAGNLHLIDANKMTEIKCLQNLHSGKITGIDASMAGIVTTSTDKSLKLLQPDLSLKVVASIPTNETGDLVSVSMDDDYLAAGSSSEWVQIWRGKKDDNSNEIAEEERPEAEAAGASVS